MQKMRLNLQFFASGTITFPASGYLQGKIDWSSTKDEKNNVSSVTAKLYARRTNSYTTTGKAWNGYVTIDNSKSSFSSLSSTTAVTNSWVLMKTYTKQVTHNTDGTKAITIAGSITGPSGTSLEDKTSSGSATVTLDPIARGSVLGEIEDFNIDDVIKIPITKYVDTFTDNLVISHGETTIKTINGITNNAEVSFTAEEKTIINNLMTSPKLELTFTLTSLNDTETIGTSIKTARVSSFDKPISFNVKKTDDGHYKWAFNGLVDDKIDAPVQVYNDEGNEILNEVVLYDNEAGSNTAITLSETSANFKYLEIFCKSGDDTHTSVKVYKPDGKRPTVCTGWFGSAAYFKLAVLTISGAKISLTQNNSEITGSNKCNTGGSTTAMYITRVVGYRN